MKFNPANIWALALVPVVILADQVSKWLILSEPRFNAIDCLNAPVPCGRIPLPGPIDFSMLWNRGMSYGFLQSEGLMRWVGFLVWLLRAEGRMLKLSLAMVVGGAFGNLIDRVRFGAVVDFIDASALHFPWVFNVADAAISVGAVLLFVDQFLLSGRKQAKA